MILIDVIKEFGLLGKADTYRTYERMVATWNDATTPIPTLAECEAKWNEMVAAGHLEPPYYIKRSQAYEEAGLSMQKVNELTNEYTQALAANDAEVIAKYQAQLVEVFAKRQAIKQQYPKP
jgi:hypothetical protein